VAVGAGVAKLSVSEWLSEQESALALVKERASLLAKLSVSAWVSAKELVSRLDSDSELE
jgi:hypothetical protein